MSTEKMSYQETLDYTQGIRRMIVDDRLGEGIPKDDDSVELVLKTIKDMDQTAIQDRRNNIEEDSADSAREVASAMREFIGMQMNQNPFQRSPSGEVEAAPLPQVDVERLGEYRLVEGETEIGTIEEGADVFIKRMQEQTSDDDNDDHE